MRKRIASYCAAVGLLALLGTGAAAPAAIVTISTFNPPLPNGYVNSTKTFDGGLWTAVYSPGWVNVTGNWPSSGASVLTGAARNVRANENHFVTLVADAGYELLLKSFEMVDGGSGQPTSVGLRSTAPTVVSGSAPTYDLWAGPGSTHAWV